MKGFEETREQEPFACNCTLVQVSLIYVLAHQGSLARYAVMEGLSRVLVVLSCTSLMMS